MVAYCKQLTCHVVWVTKYIYIVLKGDVQVRCLELLIRICEAAGIEILKGFVSSDRVHVHIEYVPKLSVGTILKRLKGKSSSRLKEEFLKRGKRYWGQHFWAIGYGVWSTYKIVNEYFERHRKRTAVWIELHSRVKSGTFSPVSKRLLHLSVHSGLFNARAMR